MFTVKVKTLNGTNESFSVDDNITVLEFKRQIADKVEIPADNQKLIFTGKVLANDKKLKEYNVEDKVVHVVRSTIPPTTRSGSSSSAASSAPQTSRSSISVGTFPSDIAANVMNMMGGADNHQDIVIDMRRNQSSGNQAHTESGRRVVLIRQWIRDANTLLDRVRDARQGTRLSSNTQTQEARDASLNSTGMQGEMLFAIGGDASLFGNQSTNPMASNITVGQSSGLNRPISQVNQPTPTSLLNQATRPASQSTHTTRSQTNQLSGASVQRAQTTTTTTTSSSADNPSVVPPVNPDLEVLSAIWREIDALQQRLQPVMQKYKQIITRSIQSRCQHNQHIFDMVHSVLHCMSHIYHAVSDITADVNRQGVVELQATAAAPPPPTAIIQQTIPVTIPLRATLNVGSPELRRRTQQNSGSTTTTTPSTAATNASTFVTQVEMDIDESLDEGVVPHPSGVGSPFNLSNIIQDALSSAGFRLPNPNTANSAAGQPSGVPAAPRPPTSGTSRVPIFNLPPNLAGLPRAPGSAGSTTAGPTPSGPVPVGGASRAPPLIPGLPPGLSLPGVPEMPQPVQRDRNDPYLNSCHSRFWCRNQTNASSTGARSSSSNTQTQTDVSTASSSSQSSSNTPRSIPSASAPSPRVTSSVRPVLTTQPTSTTTPTQAPQTHTTSNNVSGAGTNVTPVVSGVTTRAMSNAVSGTRIRVTPDVAARAPASAYLQARGRHASQTERINQMRGEGLLLNLCLSLSEAMQSQPGSESNDGFAPLMRTLNEESLEFTRSGTRPRRSILDHLVLLDEQLARPTGRFPDMGLFHALVSLIARELVVPELLLIFQNIGRPLDRLRLPLRTFIRSDVLQDGAPTNENLGDAVDRLMIPIAGFIQQIISASRSSSHVDTGTSLRSLMRELLYDLAHFIVNSKADTPGFGQALLERLELSVDKCLALLRHALGGDRADAGVIEHVEILMTRICAPLQAPLRDWLVNTVKDFLRIRIATLSNDRVPMSALSPHIHYLEAASPTDSADQSTVDLDAGMDIVASASPASNSSTTSLASEWRSIVPADWVSIIEEDIKKQLAQQSLNDPPYSDAYMAGRPSKRRKLGEEDEEDEDLE